MSYALVDGGVFANNPALCAYAEARTRMQDKPTAREMAVLSIGTGSVKTPYRYEHARDWGALGWVRPLLDIMMSGVSETVDYELMRMFEAVGTPDQYLRIQCPLDGLSGEMDNASDENRLALRALGQETAEKHAASLDKFVSKMIST